MHERVRPSPCVCLSFALSLMFCSYPVSFVSRYTGATCTQNVNGTTFYWFFAICSCAARHGLIFGRALSVECATNNGGCPSSSTCRDSVGSFNCSAYIVPGSLSSPSPTLSTSPLVFTTLSGGVLHVDIAAAVLTPASWSLTVATTTCLLATAGIGTAVTANGVSVLCCVAYVVLCGFVSS